MITLEEVCREYMIEAGKVSEHGLSRLILLAINGLKDLQYDVAGVATIVELQMDDNYMVDLPLDCLNIIRVNACGLDGRLYPLYEDRTLCPPTRDDCGNEVQNTTANRLALSSPPSHSHTRNGQVVGRQYGLGGTSRYGTFIERGGRLEFGSDIVYTNVFVEYLADPKKVNGQYEIHPFLKDALMGYIDWAKVRSRSSFPRGEKESRKIEYYRRKRFAGRRINGNSVADLLFASRKQIRKSPKI